MFDSVLKKYSNKYTLLKVKTTNMGTMYELEYRIEMKSMDKFKELIDSIRCRNGNLNIAVLRLSESETL